MFGHSQPEVSLNSPGFEPGNYLYITAHGLDDRDLALLERHGLTELAEMLPLFHSTVVPIKGSPRSADLTARHMLAKHTHFNTADLIVAYIDNHQRLNWKIVVEYRLREGHLYAIRTGALRDNHKYSPDFT